MTKYQQYGKKHGSPEELLVDVYSLTVGPHGHVYTFEERQGIKRWSPDGKLHGRIAGIGQGPGEVRWVRGMTVNEDGTLAVYDLGNRKIVLFHPDSSVTTLRSPRGYPPKAEDALQYDTRGQLWVRIHPAFGEDGRIRFPRPIFARLSSTGELRDTIFAPKRFTVRCPTLSDARYAAGFWLDKREPWLPKVEWAKGPGGRTAVGCPDEYSFDLFVGDSVLRISRRWNPVVASESEREFYESWSPMPSLPKERPAYSRIILPGDGKTWVWPVHPNIPREQSPEDRRAGIVGRNAWRIVNSGAFDVFDTGGRWIGQVELPDEIQYSGYPTEQNVVIKGDTVWAVARDSLGIETVGKYVVQWRE